MWNTLHAILRLGGHKQQQQHEQEGKQEVQQGMFKHLSAPAQPAGFHAPSHCHQHSMDRVAPCEARAKGSPGTDAANWAHPHGSSSAATPSSHPGGAAVDDLQPQSHDLVASSGSAMRPGPPGHRHHQGSNVLANICHHDLATHPLYGTPEQHRRSKQAFLASVGDAYGYGLQQQQPPQQPPQQQKQKQQQSFGPTAGVQWHAGHQQQHQQQQQGEGQQEQGCIADNAGMCPLPQDLANCCAASTARQCVQGRQQHPGDGCLLIDAVRRDELLRLHQQAYLDYGGAALYSEQQLHDVFEQLSAQLMTNPHSSQGSGPVADAEAQLRHLTLDMLHASGQDYEVVLTAGATAAIKMVGECFPWSADSTLVYTLHNHNSVLGLREYALDANAQVHAIDLVEAGDMGGRSSNQQQGLGDSGQVSTQTDHVHQPGHGSQPNKQISSQQDPGTGDQPQQISGWREQQVPHALHSGQQQTVGVEQQACSSGRLDACSSQQGLWRLGPYALRHCGSMRRATSALPFSPMHAPMDPLATSPGPASVPILSDPAPVGVGHSADPVALGKCPAPYPPYHLFALPLECNFSGARYHLDAAVAAQAGGLQALLHACSPKTDDGNGGTVETVPMCESPRGGSSPVISAGRVLVLVDAAKGCATSPPDLSRHPVDFVALSYYKIFGYPTGLGALVVRKDAMPLLRKRYFSGGTVLVSVADQDFMHRRPGHAGLEDGTLPFTSIAAACHGFRFLQRLGGFSAIQRHASCLATYLADSLTALRHANGQPAAVVYGRQQHKHQRPQSPAHRLLPQTATQGGGSGQHATAQHQQQQQERWGSVSAQDAPVSHQAEVPHLQCTVSTPSPTVTFNLLRPDGGYVGYAEVRTLAVLHGLHLRCGCFCNPGACAKYLGLKGDDLKENFAAGHACWDDQDLVQGRPTGAVRASLGALTTFEEVYLLLHFIQHYWVQTDAAEGSGTAQQHVVPTEAPPEGWQQQGQWQGQQAVVQADMELNPPALGLPQTAAASLLESAIMLTAKAHTSLARSQPTALPLCASLPGPFASLAADGPGLAVPHHTPAPCPPAAMSVTQAAMSVTQAVMPVTQAAMPVTQGHDRSSAAAPLLPSTSAAPVLHGGHGVLAWQPVAAPAAPLIRTNQAAADSRSMSALQREEAVSCTPAPSSGLAADGCGRLCGLFLYPVKSCAAQQVTVWPVGPTGLLYDREWALLDDSGKVLTQKKCPCMATLMPYVDLVAGTLTLSAPGCETRLVVQVAQCSSANKDSTHDVGDGTLSRTGSGGRVCEGNSEGFASCDDSGSEGASGPAWDNLDAFTNVINGTVSTRRGTPGGAAVGGGTVHAGLRDRHTGVADGAQKLEHIQVCGDSVCGLVVGYEQVTLLHTGVQHSSREQEHMVPSQQPSMSGQQLHAAGSLDGTGQQLSLQLQQGRDAVRQWFQQALGVPCRLVRQSTGARHTRRSAQDVPAKGGYAATAKSTTSSRLRGAEGSGRAVSVGLAATHGEAGDSNAGQPAGAVGFANDGQFLLVNTASVADLNARLAASSSSSSSSRMAAGSEQGQVASQSTHDTGDAAGVGNRVGARAGAHCARDPSMQLAGGGAGALRCADERRFRPNLVVEGFAPYAEDGWLGMQVGPLRLDVLGTCPRCDMLQVDQDSGIRGRPDILLELAQYRRQGGKMHFGILLTTAAAQDSWTDANVCPAVHTMSVPQADTSTRVDQQQQQQQQGWQKQNCAGEDGSIDVAWMQAAFGPVLAVGMTILPKQTGAGHSLTLTSLPNL